MKVRPSLNRHEFGLESVQEVSNQPAMQTGCLPYYNGAGRRIRTDDLLITNQLLYQLSYAGNC